MKFRLFNTGAIILAGSFLLLQACSSGETKNTDEIADELLNTEVSTTDDGFGETFYQVPSPEDLLVFVKHDKLKFRSDLLNPIENLSKYVDTRTKELNFGVYSADLAYSAAYSQFKESISKINSVRKLSEEIDLSAVFTETLKQRIDALLSGDQTNPDSLSAIANSSYYNMVSYLEDNDRGKTLALISAGGWVESLYIVTNSVDKFDVNSRTVQNIADQKLSFENLVMYLQKYSKDPDIQGTLDELYGIKAVFDKLQSVELNNTASVGGGKFIAGSQKLVITDALFTELKQKISEVRNNITGNSVK